MTNDMKVGDSIICVYSPPGPRGEKMLVKHKIYLLQDIKPCANCGKVWFDVGLRVIGDLQQCGMCDSNIIFPSHTTWADSILFRPIEYNSAHEELLNKEVVEEKLDIPVKEPQKQES